MLDHTTEAELALILGDPTATTIDEDRLDACIEMADSEINQYINRRYNTEETEILAALPEIRRLSVKLTFFRIYEDYLKDSELPNSIVWGGITARSILNKISLAQLDLTLEEPAEALLLVQSSNIERVTLEGRNFSNETMEKFYAKDE